MTFTEVNKVYCSGIICNEKMNQNVIIFYILLFLELIFKNDNN
jgi:hypothetical protein